jgi:hypothetical protein
MAFLRNPRLKARWQGGTHGLKDTTRSGRDMSVLAMLVAAGFAKGETHAALRLFEHGKLNEEPPRYFEQMWSRTKAIPHVDPEVPPDWEQQHPPPTIADAPDKKTKSWRSRCQRTRTGGLLSNLFNTLLALRGDPALIGRLAYDEMLRAPLLMRPGPPRPVTDTDVTALMEWLQQAGLRSVTKEVVHLAVDLVAKQHCFDPARDFLRNLEWDGTSRLVSWLEDYLGVAPSEYAKNIGIWFLTGKVARILRPGCKLDYMLVLQGPQGSLKSTACAVLAGRWFSDSLPDLRTGGKDVSQHLAGKWLIEISELSAFDRAELALLKSFITRDTERYRPSYGRKEVIEPRRCCFVGTTNNIVPEQDQRFEPDVWEEKIAGFLQGRRDVTVLEIAQGALFIETPRLSTADRNRIVAVLEGLGWRRGKRAMNRRPWLPGRSP